MTQTPKPDLSDYEEEAAHFTDVLRTLLAAKPAPRAAKEHQPPEPESES